MKELLTQKLIPIAWNERIHFECHYCGACCRHVKDSVPPESLDVYRIAKLLRDQNKTFGSIDDMLSRYAEPVPLHECGYFIYTLKTVGSDDVCIFLKDNPCMIQAAKPIKRFLTTNTHDPNKIENLLFKNVAVEEIRF